MKRMNTLLRDRAAQPAAERTANLIPVIGAIGLTALVTAFSYVGCGGGGSSSGSSADTTAPTVLSKGPAANATNVAINAVITATFSEALDPATISSTTFTLCDYEADETITGTVIYDEDSKTATLTPTADLELARLYQARISVSVKDLAGNAISGGMFYYSWSFYTRDGAWGTDGLIEANDTADANAPQIAMDSFGNALAIWWQWDGSQENIYANRYVSGTGWAGPITITDNSGPAFDPQVAMDPAGNAVAVWWQSDGAHYNIWSNRYVSPTGWAGPVLLETTDTGHAQAPQVSVNQNGDAIAIWHQSNGTTNSIYANTYISGSAWAGAGLVETGDEQAMNPQVALDLNGNATAVWVQSDGSRYNIWGNRYISGTVWATAGLIETDNTGDATAPQIAVDPWGYIMAVWQQITNTQVSILANRYVSPTGWAGAVLLETDDAGEAGTPQVAFDSEGFAIAVWKQITNTKYSIWANYYNCEGETWGGPVLLETDDSQDASNPQIAFDHDQRAIAVWYQSDGIVNNIYANRYVYGIGWGTAGLIEGAANDAINPQVALDSFGNAIAVWLHSDGARNNIRANRFVFE